MTESSFAGAEEQRTRQHAHRAFLDRYYGISRHFYDLTRKYYLFGRDSALRTLAEERFSSLVEVGPGTGRNLRFLHALRPDIEFGGLEASRAMLEVAAQKCPFARFEEGFAEEAELTEVLGRPPERILFSYCLSMVQDPEKALDRALDALAPSGRIVVVDFGDFARMSPSFARFMRRWLETFHVHALDFQLLQARGARLQWGPGRYYFSAEIPAFQRR
jgi:S-adenosylmethionine-diacylgycerolhomoserine-N-methlytransferase